MQQCWCFRGFLEKLLSMCLCWLSLFHRANDASRLHCSCSPFFGQNSFAVLVSPAIRSSDQQDWSSQVQKSLLKILHSTHAKLLSLSTENQIPPKKINGSSPHMAKRVVVQDFSSFNWSTIDRQLNQSYNCHESQLIELWSKERKRKLFKLNNFNMLLNQIKRFSLSTQFCLCIQIGFETDTICVSLSSVIVFVVTMCLFFKELLFSFKHFSLRHFFYIVIRWSPS